MAIVQQNIAREQVIAAGQILGIRQQLESCLGQRRAHIAGVGPGMILKRRNPEEITCRRHIGAHASGAVRFTGNRNLGRLPAYSFELFQVGTILTLVISDLIIQRGINGKLSDL